MGPVKVDSKEEEERRFNDIVLMSVTCRGRVTDKPVVEFGLTDSCCSLAWFNTTNILAGQ